MTKSTQTSDGITQMTESTQTPDLAAQPMTESMQMSDQAAQRLKDGIATAVERLRRIDEDVESIQSFIYVSATVLRAPGDDAIEDVARVLDSAYVQLVEHVEEDVRAALEALGETGCASSPA